MNRLYSIAILIGLLCATTVKAEEKAPEEAVELSPSLLNALQNLGANSAIPDGIGGSAYPRTSVRHQGANLGWVDFMFGLTLPISQSATDGTFLNVEFQQRSFQKRGRILLPDDRVPFPSQLTRVELGGTYLHQRENGDSWGASILGGTASDKPFESVRDLNLTLFAFYRLPRDENTAWMFYVVSSSNGQVGQNIPIPGVAYEIKGENYSATLGFPFLNAHYRPWDQWELEFNYAAVTDVQFRVHYRPDPRLDFFSGFTWTNQAWFRHSRETSNQQLFSYEKRLELGTELRLFSKLSLQLLTGYAFDRLYTESTGLPIYGRNRIWVAPGSFVTLQLQLQF